MLVIQILCMYVFWLVAPALVVLTPTVSTNHGLQTNWLSQSFVESTSSDTNSQNMCTRFELISVHGNKEELWWWFEDKFHFQFINKIIAALCGTSLVLFDAVDDVVHVPARCLLLEVGDHGVDILVVTISPPKIGQRKFSFGYCTTYFLITSAFLKPKHCPTDFLLHIMHVDFPVSL